jgi:hypothetical protein
MYSCVSTEVKQGDCVKGNCDLGNYGDCLKYECKHCGFLWCDEKINRNFDRFASFVVNWPM